MHNVELTCEQTRTINAALWDMLRVYRERINHAEANGTENNALVAYLKLEADKLHDAILQSGIECPHEHPEQY